MTGHRTFFKFLAQNKLYTFVTVLGFAVSLAFVLLLGVYVQQELSADRFHKNKNRIFLLAQNKSAADFSNPAADLIENHYPEVESYTRIATLDLAVRGESDSPVDARVLFADSSFFNIFSFELLAGEPSRVLTAKTDAVISKSFAAKMFPDENPVGKTLQIDDHTSLVITGIMADMPHNTQIPGADLVVQYRMTEEYWTSPRGSILDEWGNSSFTIYFLAAPNTDLPAKANTVPELFIQNDYWLYTSGNAKEAMFVPLEEVYLSGIKTIAGIRTNNKTHVLIYLLITLLILVVATLNYINLSVAQTYRRAKEVALKKLLGCRPESIVAQFASETMIITYTSFIFSILLAFIFENSFNGILNTRLGLAHRFSDIYFISAVIGSVSVIGFLAGLIPAAVISRYRPIDVIKRSFALKVKTTYSKLFILFQYIVSFTLCISCFFIVKQTGEMKRCDPGYRYKNLLIVNNTVKPEHIPTLRNLISGIPGVKNVSFSNGSPLSGNNITTIKRNGQVLNFSFFEIDSAFFDVFELPVKPTGVSPGSRTVWVNRKGYDALAAENGESHSVAIGENTYRIGGIIPDIVYNPLRYESGLLMLFPIDPAEEVWSANIRTETDDMPGIADKIGEVYARLGYDSFDFEFGSGVIRNWYANEARISNTLIVFTVLTLAILFMGILAMSLYHVQQAEKAIGIRRVNGAGKTQVMIMLNLDFIRWIMLAFLVSVPTACLIMQNWLENYAYKTRLDWWIFAIAGIGVLAASVIIISVQSRKTTNTNPIELIRREN